MSDVTQAVGKIQVPFDRIGLAVFSAHKFYGVKGVGALIRRPDLLLEPLVHGGRSTTAYRSGTPSLPLAASMEAALATALSGSQEKYGRVQTLNRRLRGALSGIRGIVVNSPADAVPHILNLSVLTRDADDMLRLLDDLGICVSKQTACSSGSTRSEAVFRLTGDERRAMTSFRVSLSHLTTEAEVDALVDAIREGAGS
jgi:cysteine desulfurase